MRELLDALALSKKQAVMRETWGHLKPKPGEHRGYMVFACGEYGDLVSIVSSFDGVGGDPWFHQEHMDFIAEHASERGQLYVFVGSYQWDAKAGRGRFEGNVTPVNPELLLPTSKP